MENNNLDEYKDFTDKYNELKKHEREERDNVRKKRFVIQNTKTFLIIFFILISAITLILLITRPILFQLNDYKDHFIFNMMHRLEKNFNGNFQILSPDENDNVGNNANVVYQVKGKYDIIFKAEKSNDSIYTDYDQYLYKQYVTDYQKKKHANDIIIVDNSNNWNGEEYYDFQLGIQIENYEQIETAVHNRLYDLFNEMYRRAQKDMNHYVIGYDAQIYLNDFSTTIQSYEVLYHDEDFCIHKIKMEYIKYLLASGIEDEMVTQEDIMKYNIPTKMDLYVNGTIPSRVYVSFDYASMDYFVDIGNVIGLLKNVDGYMIDKFGNIISITYKGKKFYLDDNAYLKIKGNKYSNLWTMKMFEETFNIKIEYDYESNRINMEG